MATFETAWRTSDGPVRYHGGGETVEPGDRILVRGLLRRRAGRVNYVPGRSAVHPEMEHHGLFWVGIAFDDGTFTSILVDPDTGRLKKKVVFVERGEAAAAAPLPAAPFE